MKVFDLNGRVVLEKKLERNSINSKVDVSGFQAGIYLIQLRYAGSVYQEKVVVVRD
jgi:hypothetical protein